MEEKAHLVDLSLIENCKQTADIQIICYESSEIALHTDLKALLKTSIVFICPIEKRCYFCRVCG